MPVYDRVSNWILAHKWFVALVLVVIVGYGVGKDRALRDNAVEARFAAGGNQ